MILYHTGHKEASEIIKSTGLKKGLETASNIKLLQVSINEDAPRMRTLSLLSVLIRLSTSLTNTTALLSIEAKVVEYCFAFGTS